eukprot:TRINITY_DN1660_c0_g1_i1.p1 TRINITY_DN1660_c0_g1~~TRINITY_DN1660_c0_g1_i1.p1  ORF type:complete len:261 (+),score=32.30 TRINITY_DN1660_c0_g1_i1:146-928(+)
MADFSSLSSLLSEFASELRLSPTDALLIAIAVLVAAFVVTLIVARFASLGRSKASTVALVGLCGAGKTSLFFQLRDGTTHAGTVTSMEPNEGRFPLHSELPKNPKARPVHLIDLPGHPRLRTKLSTALPAARAIIFVIDSLDFVAQLRPTAELLFDVLTTASVSRRRVPILLACNKTDKVSAYTPAFIRKQLEKEIDKIRVTRSAISDADVTSEVSLASPGEPFKFETCRNPVTHTDASVLEGSVNVAGIEAFIREYIKA